MTPEQREAFDQRCAQVRREHLARDPRVRKARRKRRRSVLSSVAGALVTVAVMLLLTKSFLLALHGPRDYARIVAPAVAGHAADSPRALALLPDPVSTGIADVLRPFLPNAAPVAQTRPNVPEPDQQPDPPEA